jgi:hypothetical protein
VAAATTVDIYRNLQLKPPSLSPQDIPLVSTSLGLGPVELTLSPTFVCRLMPKAKKKRAALSWLAGLVRRATFAMGAAGCSTAKLRIAPTQEPAQRFVPFCQIQAPSRAPTTSK